MRSASAVLLLLVAGPPSFSQDSEGPTPPGTKAVVAGERYRAGALHQLLFGHGYRRLWMAPVEVDVLDLRTFAGGLTPTTRGGGRQTQSLRFKGADGRRYGFRSADKDPTSVLPPELQGTFASRLVQDQISSSHPAGPLVVASLLEAAGILHTEPRLVVLPGDPLLGPFRQEFGGMLGTIEEYPTAGPEGTPGFGGATEIIDPPEMWKRLAAGPEDRVDARAFLAARLTDLFLGDWDRHRGQWRWARIGKEPLWQPLPEDRDQAFVRFDGLLLGWARHTHPQLLNFGPDYAAPPGATWNGRDVDRRLLTELEKPVWTDVAAALRARLTDERIDAAVTRLPEAYRRLDGARLATTLKRRRDQIPAAADGFYRFLARDVDVRGTDAPELAEIGHLQSGGLEVRVFELGPDGVASSTPYFRRRFDPSETREVRIYLEGGSDRAVVRGRPGSIRVRIVPGAGDDLVDDSVAGKTRVHDASGANRVIAGPGTKLDARSYEPPLIPAAPWIPPRDWGRTMVPTLWFGGGPDIGAFLGFGFAAETYAFRRHPYASRHSLRAGYATSARTFRAEYGGEFRRANSRARTLVGLRASGIEILRFHGFGNETSISGPSSSYKVEQQQYSFEPALVLPLGRRTSLTVGPFAKYAATDLDPGRFISLVRPYGAEGFGQVGFVGELNWDTTDRAVAASRGARLSVEGRLHPEAWDVRETFGCVQGQAAVFLTARVPAEPTLALRVGGKRVLGPYPFHEAAFLGGAATVRGLREQRYAGDGSVYTNAELRLLLGRFFLLLPGELGAFGFVDTGRVFLEGEASDRWHTGAGGGLWFAFLKGANTVSVSVARAEGRAGVYVRAGFLF